MTTQFRKTAVPQQLVVEPQKQGTLDGSALKGLEHRPFSDDEIKQAFDTFDLDHNNFVGAMEIRHILNIIGEEVTDDEIDEMISMCDSDGDGQVTLAEFQKMMTQPTPPLPPAPTTRPIKKNREAITKRYGRGSLARSSTQNLESMMDTPFGNMLARSETGLPEKRPENFRAFTVETMVNKLSGGKAKMNPSQIKKLYKRFQDIDEDGSGEIDYTEWLQALEMEDGPITKQMFRVFDMDGSGYIDMKEFVVMLAGSAASPQTEKLKFAFMMFDEDNSGYIDRNELIELLRSSFVVEAYTDQELDDRANDVFEFLGLPPDGRLFYEDFMKTAEKSNLIFPPERDRQQFSIPGQLNQSHD